MSADTAAKRYSAMNIGAPWRGLNVPPSGSVSAGERNAVMFLYSGIAAVGDRRGRVAVSDTCTITLTISDGALTSIAVSDS